MADPIVAFDVNETLLDTSALDPLFARHFGDAAVRPVWFSQMLQLAFTGGLTGRYVDFSTAQRAAVAMLGRSRRLDLDVEAVGEEITTAMTRLPAHDDVAPALHALREGGLRVVTLSNSPPGPADRQIENAGLRPALDAVLSAGTIEALKPKPEAYRLVAEWGGAAFGDVWLVAAHGWDVSGALAAGCRAAFVLRPGAVPSPIGPQPEIVAPDLREIATQILKRR
jgi:2-haloacid dehalogenase